jgi:hypothetical protein
MCEDLSGKVGSAVITDAVVVVLTIEEGESVWAGPRRDHRQERVDHVQAANARVEMSTRDGEDGASARSISPTSRFEGGHRQSAI